MTTQIKMSYEDWWATFSPDEDDDGGIRIYEPYGDDWQYLEQQDKHRVWTLVDTDEGCRIVEGYRFVNRVHYYVTDISWHEGYFYEVEEW